MNFILFLCLLKHHILLFVYFTYICRLIQVNLCSIIYLFWIKYYLLNVIYYLVQVDLYLMINFFYNYLLNHSNDHFIFHHNFNFVYNYLLKHFNDQKHFKYHFNFIIPYNILIQNNFYFYSLSLLSKNWHYDFHLYFNFYMISFLINSLYFLL